MKFEKKGPKNRQFVNDSSSTTPESTIAALETLHKPLWLLAGGADKGVDYADLIETVQEHACGAAFFGQVAEQLAERFAKGKSDSACIAVNTLEEAFSISLEKAPQDATIVLSPACSSHDQFANYRARGVAFGHLVAAHCDSIS